MRKRVSKEECDMVVTRGYMEDFLEDFMREKEYVTKDYLKEYVDSALSVQTQQIEHRMEVLMEHQLHQLQTIFESMDDRYVLRREWLASR